MGRAAAEDREAEAGIGEAGVTVEFQDHGIEIIRRGEKLYIRYDSGGIVGHLLEHEITPEEAKAAKRSEQDAYAVILALESRT